MQEHLFQSTAFAGGGGGGNVVQGQLVDLDLEDLVVEDLVELEPTWYQLILVVVVVVVTSLMEDPPGRCWWKWWIRSCSIRFPGLVQQLAVVSWYKLTATHPGGDKIATFTVSGTLTVS